MGNPSSDPASHCLHDVSRKGTRLKPRPRPDLRCLPLPDRSLLSRAPRIQLRTGARGRPAPVRLSIDSRRCEEPLKRNHKLISADGTEDAVEVVSILVDEPRRRILAFTDLVQFATMSAAGLATCAS
jgi:hypothetical protein